MTNLACIYICRKLITSCPAHNDKSQSLEIFESAGGQIFMHCKEGCSQEAIKSAILKGNKITGVQGDHHG